MATMKAVRIHGYGGSEVLSYEDAPIPQPANDEVLIRVTSTSVNRFDCAARSGYLTGYYPYLFPHILGLDVSGVVEAVGSDVQNFSAGDVVYARAQPARAGAYAEFIALPVGLVTHKPRTLSDIDAGAVPHAAVSAWRTVVDLANLSSGQTILIHAAAGGVGTMAVQLAKWRGARVIGTASARNLDLVRSLGADEVIDYPNSRFETVVRDVDVVLDLVGNQVDSTLDRSWQVLKPGGLLISLVEFPSPQVAAEHGVRSAFGMGDPCDGELLSQVGAMIDQNIIRPVISEVILLENVRRAHELGDSRHARGKIVLQVNHH